MNAATEKQLIFIAWRIKLDFGDRLPDEWITKPPPGWEFSTQCADWRFSNFERWAAEHIDKATASKLIGMFKNDEDLDAFDKLVDMGLPIKTDEVLSTQ